MIDAGLVDRGEMLCEGKTKVIYAVRGDPRHVIVQSKDDVTAGNGVRHDVIPGKGVCANIITSRVFQRLSRDLPDAFAFVRYHDPQSFIARRCNMLPFEVVVRRVATGSYVKRNPHVPAGTRFTEPIVEWHLKTSGKRWGDHVLPEDDPFVVFQDVGLALYRSDQPIAGAEPFLVLDDTPFIGTGVTTGRRHIFEPTSCAAFLALEKTLDDVDVELMDFKVEFGITVRDPSAEPMDLVAAVEHPEEASTIVIGDVIDLESWRARRKRVGKHLDKQPYRNGCSPAEFHAICQEVVELTSRF